ncbi:MAG: S8 family peptidase [Anaerolineae bacterium]|nr:S8 family peptidase [Candidatus Roseilinea sp.]MDW8449545.1 S8 family peptidase [Anaerolineae bacterium]
MNISRSVTAFSLFALISALIAAMPARGQTTSDSLYPVPVEVFAPGEVLIGLKPAFAQQAKIARAGAAQFGIATLDRLNAQFGVRSVEPVFSPEFTADALAAAHGLDGVYKLTLPPETHLATAIAAYQADPAIEYAEPNRIYYATFTPNDTDLAKQWALHNTGQTGGRADADIDMPEAWDVQRGSGTVLIAIIDTGVDYTHPDLDASRIRTDIDKDFVNKDDDAKDDHGHGTYCAGIAAASTNNARGMAGVCPNCKILPVKVLNSQGSGSAETVAQGIQYAAQAGAQILSMSLGYPSNCGCSKTVAKAINYAYDKGGLLIAASGNDSDKTRISYPASSPRVMSVGASDHNDREASFSNRGPDLNIVAPGVNIFSLDARNGGYVTESGTSAATPHVAGVAGLVWSAHPDWTNDQVWQALYQTADDFPATNKMAAEASAQAPPIDPSRLTFRMFLPTSARWRTATGRLNALRAVTSQPINGPRLAQDNCGGEPNCPVECPAQVVANGKLATASDLQTLWTLRDHVMAQTPLGQLWITLYTRHRFKTAAILLSDGAFRAQVAQALDLWMPLFRAVADPESVAAGEAKMTSAHIAAVEGVIEGLISRGDASLQDDLRALKSTLRLAEHAGWDVRDYWRALN